MYKLNVRKISGFLFFCLVFLTLSVFRIRDYGDASIDFQIILKMSSWFLFGLISFFYFSTFGFKKMKPQSFFTLLLFFVFLLSAFYSSNPLRTIVISLSFILIWLGMKMFIEIYGINSSIDFLQLSLFFFLALSLLVYFAVPSLGRQGLWVGEEYIYSSRMTGLSGGANSLGEVATVFSLLCFWKLYQPTKVKKDQIFFVFGVFILLASWNKMGIASFCLGLLIIQSRKSPLYLILGLIACFFIALLIMVIGLENIAVLLSRYGDAQEVLSFTGRAYIWPIVIDSVYGSPFFGNGFGVMFATDDKDSVGFVAAHAHNLVLQCLSTVGFIGLFIFILSFVFCLRSCWRHKNFLLLALLSVVFFRGVTESGLFMGTPNASLIIWLWIIFMSEQSLSSESN